MLPTTPAVPWECLHLLRSFLRRRCVLNSKCHHRILRLASDYKLHARMRLSLKKKYRNRMRPSNIRNVHRRLVDAVESFARERHGSRRGGQNGDHTGSSIITTGFRLVQCWVCLVSFHFVCRCSTNQQLTSMNQLAIQSHIRRVCTPLDRKRARSSLRDHERARARRERQQAPPAPHVTHGVSYMSAFAYRTRGYASFAPWKRRRDRHVGC